MRILMVVGRFPQLSETFLFRKAVYLIKRGHQVTVASRRHGDWESLGGNYKTMIPVYYLIPTLERLGFLMFLFSILKKLFCAVLVPRKIFCLIRLCWDVPAPLKMRLHLFFRHVPMLEFNPDVIHFEFLGLAAMYPFLAPCLRVPYAVSCRGADVHLFHQYAPQNQKTHLKPLLEAAAVHCVSDEMSAEVQKITGRKQGIFVIRPAVDINEIPPQAIYSQMRIPKILCLGRLVWKKGFEYAIIALSLLKKEKISFRAEIIGEGPMFGPLSYSIEDLGLQGEVKLLGFLASQEVLQYLHTVDIFLLSSLEEGISNAALEAMAAGIPIVTTDVGGMKEAVRDGIEGFVVSSRDTRAMADRLKILIQNPQLREKFGNAGRLRVLAEFSISRQIENFEKMYRSMQS